MTNLTDLLIVSSHNIKPIRAAKLENNNDILKAISYHLVNKSIPYFIGSPKLDGIRCITLNHNFYTKSMKNHKNKYILECLNNLPYNFDGELTCDGEFNSLKSQILSTNTKPIFKYNIFDIVDNPNTSYEDRLVILDEIFNTKNNPNLPIQCLLVPTVKLRTIDEILSYEKEMLDKGYEGIMLRIPNGIYKYGDSTFNEGYLFKLKRFKDSEAQIIGFTEATRNNNTSVPNNMGRLSKSSHKANIEPIGTLGAFKVRDIYTGWEFNVTARLSLKEKNIIWNQQDKYKGLLITYKYQEIGSKDAPRLPIMKSFRPLIDLDKTVPTPYLLSY